MSSNFLDMPRRTFGAYLSLILVCVLLTVPALGQVGGVKVPKEVVGFVGKGEVAVEVGAGDLNGDGREDALLVVSEVIPENAEYEEGAGERSVMVLVRGADGKLGLAARNDLVAMCRNCGGVYGDPFAGVAIKGTQFTVSNYGGSNSRWAYDYTFAYSRRDKTWQLVRAEETTFHALDPKRTTKKRVYTPPKDFGLINFADFDPSNYRGKGKK